MTQVSLTGAPMGFDSPVRFGISRVEMLEISSQAFTKSQVRITAFILATTGSYKYNNTVMHLPKILALLKQKDLKLRTGFNLNE